MRVPQYPFEADSGELVTNIEYYIDGFIGSLQSFFMLMPKGEGFLEFPRFQQAYEALRASTVNFENFSPDTVLAAVRQEPIVLIVLRTILGFSPPEFAYITGLVTGIAIDQSTARRVDKRARDGLPLFIRTSERTQQQVTALIHAAVQLILQGAPAITEGVVHRLDKADTREGLIGVKSFADGGVPYEVLLYERLLGRPFATHRDAVSERVGNLLENAIMEQFNSRQINYHQAAVAERFADMDQAPDFLIPDAVQPVVVLEAKLAEDDGTARDKVTRVQHLAELREQRLRRGIPSFEVVACVDGRGFGIRREDVRKLLIATEGKLFTLQTVDRIVDTTLLKDVR